MDVAVDFVAPARPGRYISYWRLASPSGKKFSQQVWVHIQVEDPSFVSDNKTAAVNLNQSQGSNITNTSGLPRESNMKNTSNLIDVNIEPANQVLDEHVNGTRMELLEPLIYREAAEPKKSPSASAAAPPYPMVDVPSSSENAAAFVPSVHVLAPEVILRHAATTPADVPTSSYKAFRIHSCIYQYKLLMRGSRADSYMEALVGSFPCENIPIHIVDGPLRGCAAVCPCHAAQAPGGCYILHKKRDGTKSHEN